MPFMKMPWKKNFNKLPDWVRRRVDESAENEVIVSCIKKITSSQITEGRYSHLGLTLMDGSPVHPERLIPDASVGRISRRNANGYKIVRKDLPKVLKHFGPYDVPIFGDPSRGYCSVTIPRMVYQRDAVPAAELKIIIELMDREAGSGDFVVRFEIDRVLDRTAADFDQRLLFALNVLQENTGAVNVFRVNATRPEFLGTIVVNWEILPAGEDTRQRILSSFSRSTVEVLQRVAQRFDMLSTLNPVEFVNGTSGFNRYFGAKFSKTMVVFENVTYGNALYVMDENWQELSQRSRLELLRDRPDGFSRIVHSDGWEDRLRDVVMSGR